MNHPVEQLYAARLAEAAALPSKEADYHALEQGEYGTNLRHKAVLDCTPGLGGKVLDLGCGTGLLLDKMAERGKKPTRYYGVDAMQERCEPLMARLTALGINGTFTAKPWDIRFEDMQFPHMDAALLVGVMGFWGYHTQRHVRSIHRFMTRKASHGCITFPMIWHPEQMGDLYLRRWDVDDVKDLLYLSNNQVVVLEREFIVWW